jgi:hypothetical protein
MGLGMNEWDFENMAQGFIEQQGVWICAMIVELNEHHNSKNKIYGWGTTQLTHITQL